MNMESKWNIQLLLQYNQRYRFFFRGKDWGVLTHSLWAIVFFPCFEKKKSCFFFPRKSLHATHSVERRKTPKKGQKR